MAETQSPAPPAFKTREGEARYMEAYDAVLRRWPVAYEELDLPTRFGTTHVIASGPTDAPALLLLPSMAGSATLWRPNVAALSEHYRTYAVDVIGQVGKSVQTRRLTSRQDFADWIVDLLDALGIDRASIVGSSYGGFLALNQASLTPGRVDRVVLVNPAGTFAGGLVWAFLRARVARMFSGKKERDITDLLGKGAVLHPDDEAWGALMKVTMSESARPNLVAPIVFGNAELQRIRAQVLLLIGENEVIYDARKTLRRALERMPGLRGDIIPNAHHLAALARPGDVNRRILEFLRQDAGAGRAVGVDA